MKLVRMRSLQVISFPCLALLLFAAASVSLAGGGLNPASPGLPRAMYGADNIPNNDASAMCVSCHTVAPVVGKGGHFVHQGSRTTTVGNRAAKERLIAWTSTTALSKYGNYGVNPPVSVTGVNGELICESCHNLIRNEQGGNNLVESSFNWDSRPAMPSTLTNVSTTLCEGCHVSGSLPGHHPMTGDLTGNNTVLSNSDAASPFTRIFVDNINPVPTGSSSEVVYPGVNRMGCLSCHANGHTGHTATGARILRRGWAGAASIAPVAAGSGVLGAATDGAQRQFDLDPTGVNRLIPNWQPLCDACHKVDD